MTNLSKRFCLISSSFYPLTIGFEIQQWIQSLFVGVLEADINSLRHDFENKCSRFVNSMVVMPNASTTMRTLTSKYKEIFYL
jgi:hypothetical protein